jgi:hypothetical protein
MRGHEGVAALLLDRGAAVEARNEARARARALGCRVPS